jgi:hypothetical protein
VTALETQLLFARALLLILLYTFLAAVAMVGWLDVRHARRGVARGTPAANPCRLIVIDGGASDRAPGTAFSLEAVTAVGRDLDNEIVLADPTISGRHAVVSRHSGAWWIEDLASTNGTFINSRRVIPDAPTVLRSGDLVQVGAVKMRLAAAEE